MADACAAGALGRAHTVSAIGWSADCGAASASGRSGTAGLAGEPPASGLLCHMLGTAGGEQRQEGPAVRMRQAAGDSFVACACTQYNLAAACTWHVLLLHATAGALPASADAVPRCLLPSHRDRPLGLGGQLALLLGGARRQPRQVSLQKSNLLIQR